MQTRVQSLTEIRSEEKQVRKNERGGGKETVEAEDPGIVANTPQLIWCSSFPWADE